MSQRRRERTFGKRRLDREAERVVTEVLRLNQVGHSEQAIAASVGTSRAAVRWILERTEELREEKAEEFS